VKKFLLLLRCLSFGKVLNISLAWLTYVFATLTRKAIIPPMPSAVSIEAVNYCNLQCKECATGQAMHSRQAQAISVDLAKNILENAKTHAFIFQFYWQGEPFLHSQWFQICRYAVQKNYFVMLSTHAQSMSELLASDIVKSGLQQLIISLDGFDQESYEAYRVGGSFTKTIEAIQQLQTAKQLNKSITPIITVQCLVTAANEHKLDLIKSIAVKAGADEVVFKSMQIYKNPMLLPKNSKYNRYKRSNGKLTLKRTHRWDCYRIFNTLLVDSSGNVYPCCYDKDGEYLLGNTSTKDLKDIWQSSKYQEFRIKVLTKQNQPKMCLNCNR